MTNYESSPVRVRFAPSPTGYLHVGGARTALYSYLLAKKTGGTFVLRIEDTDLERSSEEYVQVLKRGLSWLGLNWDEGPGFETNQDLGEYGPYRQSQRLSIYHELADKLIEEKKAYYCFLTDEEIQEQKKNAGEGGDFHQVVSPFRDMDLAEAQTKILKGENPVIRFKTPIQNQDYVFNDLVRGEVKFPSDMVGDFVLIRSNKMPVYNFCCVVDDALMKITHVLRAEEHLSNTLRQMMLYEALGFEIPKFGHLSVILGPDKQKLSKRHGATSCEEYQKRGYLPEALNNYLALLGWTPENEQEIMSMDELTNFISFDRFHSSPAVFDEVKLKWMNSMHLRALPNDQLWKMLIPVFETNNIVLPKEQNWQDNALNLMKSYMETLDDAVHLFKPLSIGGFTVLKDESKETLDWESSRIVLTEWKNCLNSSSVNNLTEEDFNNYLNQVKNNSGVKGKFLFMPVRVAVLGKPHGAELKELVPLISRTELIDRVEATLAYFGGGHAHTNI